MGGAVMAPGRQGAVFIPGIPEGIPVPAAVYAGILVGIGTAAAPLGFGADQPVLAIVGIAPGFPVLQIGYAVRFLLQAAVVVVVVVQRPDRTAAIMQTQLPCLPVLIQRGMQPQAIAVPVADLVRCTVDDHMGCALCIVPMDGGQPAAGRPAVRQRAAFRQTVPAQAMPGVVFKGLGIAQGTA